MKRNPVLILSIITLFIFQSILMASFHKKFKFPSLGNIKMPAITKMNLPSGLHAYFLEDHNLPLVKIYILIKTGSVLDPNGKEGLAALTMSLIRDGGIEGMNADQLDEYLDHMGATIDSGASYTSAWIKASCLASDLNSILDIINKMITAPTFDKEKLSLIKTQYKSMISRRNDNPEEIARREFRKLIYGNTSPYARTEEFSTIDSITRNSIIKFHKRFFSPRNIYFGVWGDFKTNNIIKILKGISANWPKSPLPVSTFPKAAAARYHRVNLIVRENAKQSNIRIGHIGIEKNNPDYYAVEVMNSILGSSGFLSRLMQIIRTQEGLTYGIRGGINAENTYKGLFEISCSTKSKTTIKTIKSIMREINRIRNKHVTESELRTAKDAFLNSYVFQFEDSFTILLRTMTLAFYNYPNDFLTTFRDKVSKITIEDVQRVAKKYIHPDKLAILVVGDPKKFSAPLSTYGKVHKIDITIPKEKIKEEKLPKPTPSRIAKGKIILKKIIDSFKAANQLKNLNGIHKIQNATIQLKPQFKVNAKIETYAFLPNKIFTQIVSPMFKITRILNGDKGWMAMPNGVFSLNKKARDEMQNDLIMNLMFVLKSTSINGSKAYYIGPSKILKMDVDVVWVETVPKKGLKVFVKPSNGTLVGISWRGEKGGSLGDFVEIFGPLKDFGKIKYPSSSKTYFSGQEFMTTELKSIELNPLFKKSLFEKPIHE